MADELTYYAVLPCGCLQGVVHVIPGLSDPTSTAKWVSRWVKDGLPVQTISAGDGCVLPPWACEQHKDENNG